MSGDITALDFTGPYKNMKPSYSFAQFPYSASSYIILDICVDKFIEDFCTLRDKYKKLAPTDSRFDFINQSFAQLRKYLWFYKSNHVFSIRDDLHGTLTIPGIEAVECDGKNITIRCIQADYKTNSEYAVDLCHICK